MAATSTQTLVAEGRCYECFGQVSPVQLLRLALLARILTSQNPMAATDPQSLLAYGKCFGCIGLSAADIMELALLDQIATSGGGGSASTQLLTYADSDPTTEGVIPTNQNSPAIAYKLDGSGPTYVWNTTVHIWN